MHATDKQTARKGALATNITTTVLARVGYMATRVAIPPFVMSHMGLQEYGIWTSAFILVAYLGISTMGLSNVYIRYVAKYEAEGDYRSANELLSTGLVLSVPLCAALFAALVWCWPLLASVLKLPAHLEGSAQEAVYLVTLVFLSSISLCAFNDVLNGIQRIDVVQKIWIVGYLLETVLIVLLVGSGRGVRGMAEAFFLRTAFSVVLSIVFAYRIVPWLKISPRLVSKRSFQELLSFGSVVQIQCFLDVVLNSAERVLALIFAGFEVAAILDIAKKMPNSISAIPQAYAGAFLPAASNLDARATASDRASVTRALYLTGARQMNLASAYFCGFLTLLALPILDVWLGKRFPGTPGAALLAMFSVAMQIHLLTGPGTSISKGIGRPMEEFFYCIPNLLALAVMVPVSRLLFGGYSALSVTVAVTSSTAISALYFLWHMNRQLEIPHGDYMRIVIFPGLIPYALAMPVFLIFGLHGLSDVPRLLGAGLLMVAGAVYTLAFVACAYRFLLNAEQKAKLREVAARATTIFRPVALAKPVQPTT